MRNYRVTLFIVLIPLLLMTSACAPPHPPHPGKVIRQLHRYHYFPGAEVYYHPGRRVYFYHDGGVWLSAPILPPHIHINVKHFFNIDIDGPKPYIRHHEHRRRYPPGLRKERHEKQREKFDAKKERKREKVEKRREWKKEKIDRRRDRQEEEESKKWRDRQDERADRRDEKRDPYEKHRDREYEQNRGRKDKDRDDDDDDLRRKGRKYKEDRGWVKRPGLR